MFKNYTINQTTLPLDVEHYIPETDIGFAVHSLVEGAHHLETELHETQVQLTHEKCKEKQSQLKKKRRTYKKYLRQVQTNYLPRKQKYERYAQLFQERNSFSKTDTDATFMR